MNIIEYTDPSNFRQVASLATYYKHGNGESDFPRKLKVTDEVKASAQELIVLDLVFPNHRLGEFIDWLKVNAGFDGRKPAGFDSRKKSWGAGRFRFKTEGSRIMIQGASVSGGCKVTVYFAKELRDAAVMLKLSW